MIQKAKDWTSSRGKNKLQRIISQPAAWRNSTIYLTNRTIKWKKKLENIKSDPLIVSEKINKQFFQTGTHNTCTTGACSARSWHTTKIKVFKMTKWTSFRCKIFHRTSQENVVSIMGLRVSAINFMSYCCFSSAKQMENSSHCQRAANEVVT